MMLLAVRHFGQVSAQSVGRVAAGFAAVANCFSLLPVRVAQNPQALPGCTNRYPSPSDWSDRVLVRPVFSPRFGGAGIGRSFADIRPAIVSLLALTGRFHARIVAEPSIKGRAECVSSNFPSPRFSSWPLRAVWTPTPSARLQVPPQAHLLQTQPATTLQPVPQLAPLAARCVTTRACVTNTFTAGQTRRETSLIPKTAGHLARAVFFVRAAVAPIFERTPPCLTKS